MKRIELQELCSEKNIRMIDFKMTDLNGRWRHITIPAERFNEDIFTYGIGFDGSNYGFAPVEKSDMVFIPDMDTAVIDPFTEIPTPVSYTHLLEHTDCCTGYYITIQQKMQGYMNLASFGKTRTISYEFFFPKSNVIWSARYSGTVRTSPDSVSTSSCPNPSQIILPIARGHFSFQLNDCLLYTSRCV